MNEQDRIAELEAQVERLERDLVQMQRLRRDAVAARNVQAAKVRVAEEQLQRLRRRRSVEIALATSRRLEPVVRPLLRLRSAWRHTVRSIRQRGRTSGAPAGRQTEAAEHALAAAIARDLPPPTVVGGPLVSIIILTRDGRQLLERCLGTVAGSAYRDIELVVVDNGSSDGSADYVEGLDLGVPLRVIRNPVNRSFSDANDQAAAVAAGELLCFLNNDVEPITDGWLGYMVETLQASGAAAVGARLVYPASRGRKRAGARFADLTLQHGGVAFDRTEPVPYPRVVGAGADPLAPEAVEVADRPALTAACLLVRRTAFTAIGGFRPEYDYGLEDVDLCLRLQADGGRLVYDGRAVLWHHESTTRITDAKLRRSRIDANRQTYLDLWGPRIFREALLDALVGGTRFGNVPFHLATVGTVASDLEASLAGLGWLSSRPTRGSDGAWDLDPAVESVLVADDAVDIRLLPARLISIALIGNDVDQWVERPWIDDYDIILATDPATADRVRERTSKVATTVPAGPTAGAIRDAITTWATSIRYAFRVGSESRAIVERWGDYHFARAMQRALERTGHPTRIHILPEWAEPIAAREDVVIHLFGFKEAPTRPSQVNILWQISHPDLASPEMYERYDQAFVASDRFAATMAARTTTPVASLHQATDPERFRPDPTGPAFDLLFVGNSRNTRRRIVDDVIATGHDIAVFGAQWHADLIDPRFVRGEGIPNAELNRYYSAAAIVLNDHWNDMVAEGFISNRLYDALACGAFVISDFLPELDAEFDRAVVSYTDRAELGVLIDRYLADPDERRTLGARGRAAVLARHTFDDRARVLRETVAPLLAVVRSR